MILPIFFLQSSMFSVNLTLTASRDDQLHHSVITSLHLLGDLPHSRLPSVVPVVTFFRSQSLGIRHKCSIKWSFLSLTLSITVLQVQYIYMHCSLSMAGIKLCCLVKRAYRCEQLAEGCYAVLPQLLLWTLNLVNASPAPYLLCYCATSFTV